MQQVLVLNYDYTPLNVTSLQRGFVLVDKGKAEVIKQDENHIVTTYKTYVRPLIIRLLRYINYRSSGISVNRHRIFKRDGHQCGYCGSTRDLTIDHIQPRSRGGRNTWTNLVTCKKSLNVWKSDRTPQECGLKLLNKPFKPSNGMVFSFVRKEWEMFVDSGKYE